jgi:hypothetical protein
MTSPARREAVRRHHRFKDQLTGDVEYRGASYPCVVTDISQRGLYLTSNVPVKLGDRMRVDLRIAPDRRFSCMTEIRQITSAGLGAEIIDITDEDARVLVGRIEDHCSAVRLAKEAEASGI